MPILLRPSPMIYPLTLETAFVVVALLLIAANAFALMKPRAAQEWLRAFPRVPRLCLDRVCDVLGRHALHAARSHRLAARLRKTLASRGFRRARLWSVAAGSAADFREVRALNRRINSSTKRPRRSA